MKKDHDFSVGEVSARSGVAISALHFYESKGLIRSTRNQGNHRRYHRSVLRKISVIKAAQKAGIPLKEIASQLSHIPDSQTVSSKHWAQLAKQWKHDLDERITRLELLRDTMAYCIGCGCLSEKYCELINPDDRFAHKGQGPLLLEPEGMAEFNGEILALMENA
ncbi:redox-sensitive transcriptional activator SoxR [Endozoicomonas ascidiicola]|uniref:redox-sensitive transcriptional activator SoxR n=1 Tax=Endozoicomonas ascidiicola TaxID=1698521 RepID=UPI001FE06A2F|nr:redox-sensitive transcriptional activator SoxR [Endozoicomonas ascidiicola]